MKPCCANALHVARLRTLSLTASALSSPVRTTLIQSEKNGVLKLSERFDKLAGVVGEIASMLASHVEEVGE